MHDAERTRLWSEWLQTDDGKDYRAGWGDLWTQLHGARGKAWVAERIIERLTAEVERITRERDALIEASIVYQTFNRRFHPVIGDNKILSTTSKSEAIAAVRQATGLDPEETP